MQSPAMKTLLVNVLCIFPLLRLGETIHVTAPYATGTEKMGRFLQEKKHGSAITVCDGASRSVIKHTDLQQRWVIETFRDQEELQKLSSIQIQSAELVSPDNKHKFIITLENAGSKQNQEKGAQRSLRLYSLSDKGSVSLKARFDIVSGKNGSLHSLPPKVIHLNKTKANMELLEVPLPENVEEYIDDDALIILCSISIYEQTATICDITSRAPKEDTKAFMASFKKLLKDKTGADLHIKASDCVIPAHRSILLARSSVMDSLIEENESDYLLNATEFSCDAMNCVVNYIYTDKCTMKPEIAEEVLLAARKYELRGLEQMAESELVRSLDKKNVASRAKSAKNLGSTNLVRAVSKYIVENPNVLNSDAWKKLEMKESCPSALVLREIALRM